MKRFQRREFLKKTGAGVLGVASRPLLGPLHAATRSAGSAEAAADDKSAVVWNRAPLRQFAYAKLPVTAFEPAGWVRVALERQRDGMNGHLGEISAWLEKKNNAWLSPEGKGDHGWEELPYWLRGYVRMAILLNDQDLLKESQVWIEGALKNQRPNGDFGQQALNDKGGLDVWPQSLMIHALRSWYEYSGDARVIALMRKYFQWQMTVPDEKFGKDVGEMRAGDHLASVYWLYGKTGDKFLIELAKKIDRCTANWRQNTNLPDWHVVDMAEGFREPAMYSMQSLKLEDVKASYNDFHLVRDIYGQLPGGMYCADENAREGFTDPHQGTELDGMIEQIFSDGQMVGITGDPMWAENAEVVAFNSMPAGFMADYSGLRYLTAPNMVVSNAKDHSPGIQNGGPMFAMNPLSHRCCQHNSSNAWANFVEYSWMATPDHGLVAQYYCAGNIKAKVGKSGTEVKIKVTTKYPFEDVVNIEVAAPQAVEFPLVLRIPSWAHGATIEVNGKAEPAETKPGSYARVTRTWKPDDQVRLRLPMTVSVTRWEKNKNSASVNYGPLTFSLRIKERYEKIDSATNADFDSRWQSNVDTKKWTAYEIYPESDWNYGLMLPEGGSIKSFTVVPKAWPQDGYPFALDAVPLEMKAQGKKLPQWKIDENGLCGVLPQSPVKTDQAEEEIVLVPMGAARLRISAFPVVS